MNLQHLQAVELGEFEEDPAADDLTTFAEKFNDNMEVVDPALTKVGELDQQMNFLELKGLTTGFVFGGSY